MSFIKIGKPPACKIAKELLCEIFSKALIAFSAISMNSKFCILSHRTSTPPCLTITSDKFGANSKIFDSADAE